MNPPKTPQDQIPEIKREIEFLKNSITDQMIKGQWYYKDKESLLFFIREWVSDFESRFKKLEEGQTR